jgi:hypothetical protein
MSKYFCQDDFEINDDGTILWYSFDEALSHFNRELYNKDKEIYKMEMKKYQNEGGDFPSR